jgi:hypothetical protein
VLPIADSTSTQEQNSQPSLSQGKRWSVFTKQEKDSKGSKTQIGLEVKGDFDANQLSPEDKIKMVKDFLTLIEPHPKANKANMVAAENPAPKSSEANDLIKAEDPPNQKKPEEAPSQIRPDAVQVTSP